jgi:hypothetical protein
MDKKLRYLMNLVNSVHPVILLGKLGTMTGFQDGQEPSSLDESCTEVGDVEDESRRLRHYLLIIRAK